MSSRPALSATKAMISSGALPKVALSSPPMASPVRVGDLLGGAHDQARDRDDGERRREEHPGRRHPGVLERERDGDEDEQPVKGRLDAHRNAACVGVQW